jgi:predicted nuclease with TOPRIM domain
VEVDSLEVGIRAVERAAMTVGGWVAHSSLSLGEREHRQARLELKIPSARWGELLTGLERVGDLQQLSTATEDVGEQFVDLTAQLENARRLEERYLQLLETRTGTLEDLLSVERELARVRERIEMMQGRLRYLEQRVSISTLVVNLHEPVDLLAIGPDEQPIRDAFRAAWANFLGVITGGIALLGGALPLAMLGAALLWGWRRSRQRV